MFVRYNPADGTGYAISAKNISGTNNDVVQVFKYTTATVSSQVGTDYTITGDWVDGNTLKVDISGSSTVTIAISINGTLVKTVTDSSSPLTVAGRVGARVIRVSSQGGALDDFSLLGVSEPTISGVIGGPCSTFTTITIVNTVATFTASAVTDSSGNYSIPVPYNYDYTVTPSGANCLYAPTSLSRPAVTTDTFASFISSQVSVVDTFSATLARWITSYGTFSVSGSNRLINTNTSCVTPPGDLSGCEIYLNQPPASADYNISAKAWKDNANNVSMGLLVRYDPATRTGYYIAIYQQTSATDILRVLNTPPPPPRRKSGPT